MRNLLVAGSILVLASACGQTTTQSSEVQSARGPITSACQLKLETAFKCTLVNGEKVSVFVNNGEIKINENKISEYNVTKTVDAASGNVSYRFDNIFDSKASPVTVSTGKDGKGIGSVIQGTNRKAVACKFAATRDTAVLNFIAQNNGICHPR